MKCLKCGKEMRKKIYILAAIALMSLVGCGNNDAVEDVRNTTSTTSATSVGNSLVENQVKLVAADWKQNNTGNISDFKKKFDIVYGEYEVLSTRKAENELKKINLTLDGHEYCGSGKLDMMEWLNTYIR